MAFQQGVTIKFIQEPVIEGQLLLKDMQRICNEGPLNTFTYSAELLDYEVYGSFF